MYSLIAPIIVSTRASPMGGGGGNTIVSSGNKVYGHNFSALSNYAGSPTPA